MDGFIGSFLPLFNRFKKYQLEIAILFLASLLTIAAVIIYVRNNRTAGQPESPIILTKNDQISAKNISVDLSGAVKNPGLYEVNFGARLKDVIDKAGSLSDEADTTFFKRNFNLARVLADQEKIYIPSIYEINEGIIVNSSTLASNSNKISLNSATVDELDHLPGVGPAIADKIITNRPYSTLDDVLTKKAVSKTLFDNIKGLISL